MNYSMEFRFLFWAVYLWNLSWHWLLNLAATLCRHFQTHRFNKAFVASMLSMSRKISQDVILQAAQSLTAIYRALHNDADGVEDELMEP